jgi:hypothetical protein
VVRPAGAAPALCGAINATTATNATTTLGSRAAHRVGCAPRPAELDQAAIVGRGA